MVMKCVITEILPEKDQTNIIRVLYTDGQRFNVKDEYRFSPGTFSLDGFKATVFQRLASFPSKQDDPSVLLQLGDFDPTVP